MIPLMETREIYSEIGSEWRHALWRRYRNENPKYYRAEQLRVVDDPFEEDHFNLVPPTE